MRRALNWLGEKWWVFVCAAVLLAALYGVARFPPVRLFVQGTGRNCGHLVATPAPGAPSDVGQRQQALTCFARAYRSCQVASLTTENLGVDASESDTFVVLIGVGGCGVADKHEASNASTHQQSTVVVECGGLREQPAGLRIAGCAQFGDLVVTDGGGH